MLRPTSSQKAFTIIEVLMAAMVLVVSFSAIIQAVTMGTAMIDTARKQQIAQQIIEGEIAFQRSSPWLRTGPIYGTSELTDLTFRIRVNDTGTTASDDIGADPNVLFHFGLENNPTLMAAAKGFTCEVRALDETVVGFHTSMSVTYTVTWRGHLGRVHTRTGWTTFSQNGLQLSYQQ